MKKIIFSAIAVVISLSSATPVQAQNAGTESEIIFVQEKEDEARQQLRRILSSYDLDNWIFTEEVRIKMGAQPYSHPILTLNTDFLDSDEQQMSIFVHEQAHWFVSDTVPYRAPKNGEEVEIINELRQLFPNAPVSGYSTFLHLIVGWVELDAMVELVGEEKARQLLRKKIQRLTGEPLSQVDQRYKWYNMRVLENTQEIGMILAEHDLIITPGKGLIVK
ncbi:hypothetical protein [Fodinibius salsisoli]|uniref:Peptidase family M48 n=1 Tax=Fodinibius salsisoli TaxID=2820877 RepID=A0ABT3PT15_9BACT|nr:hypothetical protein [Fodinibius salsisoli]MCW9709014.1 hypothetical protein [Fodinibius salsisoli]